MEQPLIKPLGGFQSGQLLGAGLVQEAKLPLERIPPNQILLNCLHQLPSILPPEPQNTKLLEMPKFNELFYVIKLDQWAFPWTISTCPLVKLQQKNTQAFRCLATVEPLEEALVSLKGRKHVDRPVAGRSLENHSEHQSFRSLTSVVPGWVQTVKKQVKV